MAKEFLGIGWKFPVRVDSEGKIAMSEYETDIKEAIKIILGTAKGERVMRPDFGCGIHDFVFSPVNKATLSLVENTVRESLTFWEPRIELIKVEAIPEVSAEEKLLVSIDYRVRVTNNRFNLVYPFYLKEG
jgi:phage baseplate assembly protein W